MLFLCNCLTVLIYYVSFLLILFFSSLFILRILYWNNLKFTDSFIGHVQFITEPKRAFFISVTVFWICGIFFFYPKRVFLNLYIYNIHLFSTFFITILYIFTIVILNFWSVNSNTSSIFKSRSDTCSVSSNSFCCTVFLLLFCLLV